MTPSPAVAADADAAATAAAWERELAAVRERMTAAGARAGLADRDAVAGLSGLQIIEGVRDGTLPYAPIADTLDFAIVDVARGRTVFQGTPQFAHYNPLGSVHGGWYATLLDSAMGCAVHTMLPAGRSYTTAELSVNLVRAATTATGPLRAIGSVVHCGRRLATAEGRLVGADGTLYAHGTTTCLVFDPRTG